jgi:glycosyltransferase involved in cell wall biosynthesis
MRLHVVMPEGVDDPARPSGGNVYDRRLVEGLRRRGHQVVRHVATPADLEPVLVTVPDRATVVVDGLVACFAPRAVERHASRLRLVVLAHMCFGEVASDAAEDERRAVLAADAVLAVSEWTRDRLLGRYALDPARVTVAEPGTDPAAATVGTAAGNRLLCVGAVTRAKGVDVLVDALRHLDDLAWTCRVVGPTDREPAFAAAVRGAAPAGLTLVGPLPHAAVQREYAGADLVVLPTRTESFGIVAVEALAHGLPVLGSEVGGLPEAVGRAPDGQVPGLLVRPGDAEALATALRAWLTDPGLRAQLRAAASGRRPVLGTWEQTVDAVEHALALAVAEVAP